MFDRVIQIDFFDSCELIFYCLDVFTVITRWLKYDRDYLCVNKSQFVPVIFEPPCILYSGKIIFGVHLNNCVVISEDKLYSNKSLCRIVTIQFLIHTWNSKREHYIDIHIHISTSKV
jgi:hypothetical protein